MAGDGLGTSVATTGSVIYGGANSQNSGQGAVYQFNEPGSAWANATTPSATITASDGVIGDDFGFSMAAAGGELVVGADDASVGANTTQGKAYVFQTPAAPVVTTNPASLTVVLAEPGDVHRGGFGLPDADGAVAVGSERRARRSRTSAARRRPR